MDISVITEEQAQERFDDWLDEIYPVTKIAGYEYRTSYALKDIDPIAYREEFLNWCNYELEDNAFSIEDW